MESVGLNNSRWRHPASAQTHHKFSCVRLVCRKETTMQKRLLLPPLSSSPPIHPSIHPSTHPPASACCLHTNGVRLPVHRLSHVLQSRSTMTLECRKTGLLLRCPVSRRRGPRWCSDIMSLHHLLMLLLLQAVKHLFFFFTGTVWNNGSLRLYKQVKKYTFCGCNNSAQNGPSGLNWTHTHTHTHTHTYWW